MKFISGHSKKSRGSAIIELAVVFPVLMVFLLVITDLSQMLRLYQSVDGITQRAIVRISKKTGLESGTFTDLPSTTGCGSASITQCDKHREIQNFVRDNIGSTESTVDTTAVKIETARGSSGSVSNTVSIKIEVPYRSRFLRGTLLKLHLSRTATYLVS